MERGSWLWNVKARVRPCTALRLRVAMCYLGPHCPLQCLACARKPRKHNPASPECSKPPTSSAAFQWLVVNFRDLHIGFHSDSIMLHSYSVHKGSSFSTSLPRLESFTCVYAMYYTNAWCLQRPEEGIRSPGTVGTDHGQIQIMSCLEAAGNQNHIL